MPIYAFRVWRLMGDDGALYSTGMRWQWPSFDPGRCQHLTPTAAAVYGCNIRSGTSDFAVGDCTFPKCTTCGFYSYSTLTAALESSYGSDATRVRGVVEISGTVRYAPCQKPAGTVRFRSEYAQIVALFEGPWDHDRYRVATLTESEARLMETLGYTMPPPDESLSGS